MPEWMKGATQPFEKVLIANRGEIACRIIRACRELGLGSVAVFASNDANSLFVEMADESVHLPGEDIASTYLDGKAIILAAKTTGAGAIHPGFGFLSERATFAEEVVSAGLVWIGPSPHAITSMGDKMTSRIMMREAGVPVIPGEELDLEPENPASESILSTAAESVGYPLLLKATAGGGGKGMRAVYEAADLLSAWQGASREALSAFGDGRVYVERLLSGSRHVEIQVLADQAGKTLHLGERECSIQRRHQKVLEESPSPAVNPALRTRMGEAAVSAAKAVDYVGAGTVEFLLCEDDEFFFLEMNTRIQVEHPITEMVTGIDLVQQQLRIAAGLDIPFGQGDVDLKGHAIEVRLYAEDPANNFLPAIGPLAVFSPPKGVEFRLDTGVREGDEVTPDYDPMLAKLIVHADDRDIAIRKMGVAIREFVVLGCQTNLSFLADLLTQHSFRDGHTPTNFIEEHWPEGWDTNSIGADVESQLVCLAALAVAAESFGLAHRSGSGELDEEANRGDFHNPFLRIGRRFP